MSGNPGASRDGADAADARSWLFVPGAQERFVAKLAEARPDAVVLDLEDGVAAADLGGARERLRVLLEGSSTRFLPALVAVRTHPVPHPEFVADMGSLGERVTHVVLPKVASAEELGTAATRLAERGLARVGLVPMVESAAGLSAAPELLRAHGSVVGIAFGAEDFAADVGLPPGDASSPVIAAAATGLVLAAAAAGLACRIDSPSLGLGGLGGLGAVEEASRRSRALGFSGRFAVHPAQLPAVHAGFAPSPPEVAWARTVLAALESADDAAVSAAGQMVDEAVARRARAVLRSAERPT